MGDRFSVNIAGYSLTVTTERSAEHMERLSKLMNERVREVQKSGGTANYLHVVMLAAMKDAGVSPDQVDYINATLAQWLGIDLSQAQTGSMKLSELLGEQAARAGMTPQKLVEELDRQVRVPGLAKVVYHGKLGTQGERALRVQAIAHAIVSQLRLATVPFTADDKDHFDVLDSKVAQAALLAKTDLMTDMVGEFPELQGIMGGYYARSEGLRDGVAIAIEDHYKPRFAGDALPRNHTGTVLALADKLETLVGLFGIGQLPTGDKDPFALRRHALGVIRILIEKKLSDFGVAVTNIQNFVRDGVKHGALGVINTDWEDDGEASEPVAAPAAKPAKKAAKQED